MKQSNLQIVDPYNMTPQEAQSVIGQLVDDKEETRWKFYTGDHWQDMNGWIGPVVSGEGLAQGDFVAELERSFIFYNSCKEIVKRHVDALLAKPMQWGAAIERVLDEGEEVTSEEEAKIARIDEVMTQWFDSKNAVYIDDKGVLKTCTINELLTSAASRCVATDRAYLRIFIPPKHLNDGQLKRLTLEDALARIYVELCDIKSAAMYVEPSTIDSIGIYVYKDVSDDTDQVELTYVNPARQTVLSTRYGETSFDLGGRLLHHQMNTDGLLKDSVLSQQKDLNRILTMSGRNMNLAGFPERVLLDGMLPGEYIKDPVTGKKRFEPDPFMVGPGTMNVFNGITYKGIDGEDHHISPSYQRLDPVGNMVFDQAIAQAQQRIRDEADQSHVAMSSDATASGRSREQARHEFTQSLLGTELAVESALDWMLSVVIRLGLHASTESPALIDGVKFNVEARISSGPVGTDDRAEDRSAVTDGVMSKETAMSRIGIDDVDVERARIESESKNNTTIMLEKANLATAFISNTTEPESAYKVAGFDEDQVADLSNVGFERESETDDTGNES